MGGVIIPLVGCMIPIVVSAIIGFIIWTAIRAKSKREEEIQKTIRMSIEKGQPLPPEFLQPQSFDLQSHYASKSSRVQGRDLRNGLVLIALGAAFMCWSYLDEGYIHGGWAGIGALLLLLGAAFTILGIIGNLNKKS